MSFTDDDLNQFKKAVACDGTCSGNVYLPHDKYAALLARLEAAEDAIKTLSAVHEDCTDGTCATVLEIWRNVTGKLEQI